MNKKFLSIVCFVIRYTLMFWLFDFISFMSYSSFQTRSQLLTDIEYLIDPKYLDLAALLLVFPAYFSVARTFSITEPNFKAAAMENKEHLTGFVERAKFVLSTPFIYFEAMIVSFFILILPKGATLLQVSAILPVWFPKLPTCVILISCAFFISLMARVSAVKSINFKERFDVIKFGRGDVKYNLWYQIRMSALLIVLYPLSSMAVLYVVSLLAIPFVMPFADILLIVLIVFAAAIPLTMLRHLRALSKRRKFIKKLRALCKKNKFRIEKEKNMIRSATHSYEGYNFIIHANNKSYACKLVGSKRKSDPMYFTENGEVYVVKSKSFTFLGGVRGMGGVGATLNSINLSKKATVSSFAFESEHTKIVIVNPIPTKIFAGHPEHSMPIDTGAKVGEYRIFNASGFMNALERDCVER